ncbi:wall-associated receptor kinase 2-like [Olea europaea var. sylvestris]|uniref:wall-associated receptor kinase 2-like n=1 Tax=Olea europaea var. sylvestris TaxID=158386 RepID=UPI000C1CCD64|nr:wall-associated receptor kinase 2-like [Olea europaea var. sylvestris]
MNSFSIILQIMLLGTMLMPSMMDFAFQPSPYCPTRCGDIPVPFPFGTISGCHLDESFFINCNKSYNPPKPFLNFGEIEVINISIDGQIRIAASVASYCYGKSGSQINGSISKVALSKFHFSGARNKFTVVGCDTYAVVDGSEEWKQRSAGCASWCHRIDSVIDGTCAGLGCCQTSIPEGVKDFLIDIRSFQNHSRVKTFNPCGYAFVVEAEAFNFSSLDLQDLRGRKTVPVVLDWSIGNGTCLVALEDLSSYACRAPHSDCIDLANGLGYRCNCLMGYQGNPYLVDGCHDIDECISRPCEGTCTNLLGSYLCSCPKGFEGDGKKDGTGCRPKDQTKFSILIYIVAGSIFPFVGSSWIFWKSKKQKVVKLRHKLFKENGGLILQEMLSRRQGLKIFTAEDLKRATNNYDETTIVFRDGYNQPAVYKGTLPDDGVNKPFFIEKYETSYSPCIEDFIRKLIVLSRISNVNVAKLIGCCLETPDPFLVYEFFTGKTLYDLIHDQEYFLSWDLRLKIAFETASSLAYLHSAGELPIVHGDITSFCIFLDSSYNVKISQPSLNGCVCTLGYLDPENDISGISTKKGDVYSFGVVLAEILTGKEVVDLDRPEGEQTLADNFVSAAGGDGEGLHEILVHRLQMEKQLKEVAMLTERCLRRLSEERPTMNEVAKELKTILSKLELDKDRAQLNPGATF